jgi:hypothetical protein
MPVFRADSFQQFAAINVLSDPGYSPGQKIIPNAAQLNILWGLPNGKTAHNVMYATYNGTPALGAGAAQSIFAAISAGATWTAMAAHIAPTVSLRAITLLDVRSNAGVVFQSTGTAVPGTSTGAALPGEVAIAVRFVTTNRGPSGRGRVYLPGWATTALTTGDVILAATVTAINTWMANTVFPAITSAVGAPVLGLPARKEYTSPTTGRFFPARAASTVVISNVLVPDNHWDSQRRRGLK